MGVVLSMIRVSSETLAELKGNSRAVAEFVYGDPKLASGPGFLSRLFGKKEPVVEVPNRREDDEFDFDKLWDIVNFLFTNGSKDEDHPLSFLTKKWPDLCTLPGLLGPPMAIDHNQVIQFFDSLSKKSDQELVSSFDSQLMIRNKVYFKEILEEDADELKSELVKWIQEFRQFVKNTVASNESIIIFYS